MKWIVIHNMHHCYGLSVHPTTIGAVSIPIVFVSRWILDVVIVADCVTSCYGNDKDIGVACHHLLRQSRNGPSFNPEWSFIPKFIHPRLIRHIIHIHSSQIVRLVVHIHIRLTFHAVDVAKQHYKYGAYSICHVHAILSRGKL